MYASCSLDKTICADTALDMATSTIVGLGKFSLLFVAPGLVNIIEIAMYAA